MHRGKTRAGVARCRDGVELHTAQPASLYPKEHPSRGSLAWTDSRAPCSTLTLDLGLQLCELSMCTDTRGSPQSAGRKLSNQSFAHRCLAPSFSVPGVTYSHSLGLPGWQNRGHSCPSLPPLAQAPGHPWASRLRSGSQTRSPTTGACMTEVFPPVLSSAPPPFPPPLTPAALPLRAPLPAAAQARLCTFAVTFYY